MNAMSRDFGPGFGSGLPLNAQSVPQKLRILGYSTSVRLEDDLWSAFDAICVEIGSTRQRLASRIAARSVGACGMTTAMRLFLLRYWQVYARFPGVLPEVVVRQTLEEMIPVPTDPRELSILRFRDVIAPHLTPARVRAIAAAVADDPARTCAVVSRSWGEATPWGEADPALVGRALIDLVSVSRVKRQSAPTVAGVAVRAGDLGRPAVR